MKAATPTSIADQVEAQIDRSQWRIFKFSDLAKNINEKISPKNSDLTHYIGLEHLDSGSLKIRRFGDPKAIKGDKLKIYKGDLIFAKRNAYLKRVSVAEFDAIASAHSMVLRAKPQTILPEFLPFFMLSETFSERAIAISVGSLSPTINWKALAKQEFLLPPIDQQAKLAELLWAADATVETLSKLNKAQSMTRSALMKEAFTNGEGAVPIGELIKLSSGKSRPKDLESEPLNDHVYPVYGGNGIIGYSTQSNVKEPTIILGRVGEYCGVVHDSYGPSWVTDNALYVKEWNRSVDRTYLSRFLEFLDLNKQQTGGGQPLITQSLVYRNKIPIPSPERIEEVAIKLNQTENTQRKIRDQQIRSGQLLRSLINQIF